MESTVLVAGLGDTRTPLRIGMKVVSFDGTVGFVKHIYKDGVYARVKFDGQHKETRLHISNFKAFSEEQQETVEDKCSSCGGFYNKNYSAGGRCKTCVESSLKMSESVNKSGFKISEETRHVFHTYDLDGNPPMSENISVTLVKRHDNSFLVDVCLDIQGDQKPTPMGVDVAKVLVALLQKAILKSESV